jgi:hypothetical protein
MVLKTEFMPFVAPEEPSGSPAPPPPTVTVIDNPDDTANPVAVL